MTTTPGIGYLSESGFISAFASSGAQTTPRFVPISCCRRLGYDVIEPRTPMPNPHAAEWMLVLVCAPGKEPEAAGILLLNTVSDQLSVKLKPLISLDQSDETIVEVWQVLAADLESKARTSGGAAVLDWLESMASHVFQVSLRYRLEVADFPEALKLLYIEHVEKAAVSLKIADVS